VGLNVLYVISNIIFLRLDKRVNFGNVEYGQLGDGKKGYTALEGRTFGEDSAVGRMSTGDTAVEGRSRSFGEYDLDALPVKVATTGIHIWRVRIYICLCGLVLLFTWISFGIIMGYRRS